MKEETESERTLNSLEGMQRATMPQALRERIVAAIPSRRSKVIALSRPTILLIAAGLALLIGFNVYSIAMHKHAEQSGSTIAVQANSLAEDYFMPAPSI